MAWTEQDLREIEDELKKGSQGVGDVPEAESLDGITSLPAYQEKDGEDIIVRAPLELLAAPALEAADKANAAATKAESNATAAQTAANSANEKAELAAKAASDANAAKEGAEAATQSANTAASNANEKASLANTAAANANDTAEHPTYIGTDHYVYKWNKTAQAYDKTDIYTKGDAFSIKKVYASVAEMEADKGNPDIAEGDFALVNTGDVEDPDNAKLYVKAAGDYEFLVDMSGAIGFTGKTPQFSMGTVTTLEAGASAIVTVSDDGTDDGGNPKYKINFAIPRGNPGAPFRVSGEYATLEALKSAIPDGSAVDGFMAVGTEAPYDYYAWVNGEWISQGKIGGIDEAPSDGNTYGRKNEDWVEVLEKSKTVEYIRDLRETDLDTFKGGNEADIAFIGVQRNNKFATPENHYPRQEAGILIVVGTITDKTNQIYQTYDSNRLFMRCATSSGENGSFSDWKELVRDSDVLTKTNTSSFTPTGDYQPATKKYVDNIGYGKVIDVDGNDPINNINAQGTEAENRINRLFGSINSFKNVVIDIANSHAKYHFHLFNLTSNCIEMGSVFAYVSSSENNRYLLSFIFTYLDYCKHCKIDVTDVSKEVIIKDLVASDNLTTLTKKTADEYDVIGSKDANTAYCVTD